MNVTCPHCTTVYRVDARRVAPGGVRARCMKCEGVFRVRVPEEESAPPEVPATPGTPAAEPEEGPVAVEATPPPPPPAAPAPFGVADPDGRARRLARALVSDIVVYHPERRERGLQAGTLRQEFREEIRKSWDEFVAQVGEDVARRSPHFREALNDILAGGNPVF